jgi:hypothetical protein
MRLHCRRKAILLLITLVLASVACAGREASDTIPSPAATAALPTPPPTAISMTTMPATATAISPPATALPSPPLNPTPTPTPCPTATQPDLIDFWDKGELGCPVNPGQPAISTAYAPFEGGQMLWRSDADIIYVLYHDGRWESYPNEWEQSIQEFSCGEENSPPTPVRGFGRVWCDHPDVREALGAVTAVEIGDSASAVQDFGNGTILVAPFGSRFIFINETGMWRRIDVEEPLS